MAAQVCQMSDCLATLIVRDTKTTAEQGKEFLQTLADIQAFNMLSHLDLSGFNKRMPSKWFLNQDATVEILLVILARQTQLQSLKVIACVLSDEQKQKIRDAIADTTCRVIFTYEEEKAYDAEQVALEQQRALDKKRAEEEEKAEKAALERKKEQEARLAKQKAEQELAA